MEDYANALMALYAPQDTSSRNASAVFGTAGSLASSVQRQESLRIGLWPCISQTDPETAMGLMTALAFLLESWREIRAYRLFINAQGDPAEFYWTPDKSQFDVEEFEPESLDENVAVWGTLEKAGGTWKLELSLESDVNDADEITLPYEGHNLADLVNQLPEIAQNIATHLDQDRLMLQTYDDTLAADSALAGYLQGLFRWQVHLLLTLWGHDASTDDTETELDRLIDAARIPNDSFSAWGTAAAAAHSMLPGYGQVADAVYGQIGTVIDALTHSAFPSIYLSNAVFAAGETERAFEILEAEAEREPTTVLTWLTLAELYRRSGRYMEMLDTFQRAIESEAVSAALYRNYAAVLEAVEDPQMIDEFVLIDPDEFYDSFVIWEAAAAYDEALRLDPDSVTLWARLTQTLVNVAEDDEERFLEAFKQLVAMDKTGEQVRSITEALYNLDDIDSVLDILEETAENNPDDASVHINLAAAYLVSDDLDFALEELDTAESITDDLDILADIERLRLTASDSEFEARLGEIEALLDGDTGRPSPSDVRFLENMVEQAPRLNEGYILLGRAHLARDSHAEALETLMDGLETHPNDLDMLTLAARGLWETGEYQTAFKYLQQGLAVNANYVPLLALTGQYLFEDGREQDAKAYLARAEAISPRHPALARARQAIVEQLNRNP